MDFKKLGKHAGRLRKQAEDKLGDRADPEVLKKDAKELREILAGDGSLAEKAKEAREHLSDSGEGSGGNAPDSEGGTRNKPAGKDRDQRPGQ